ncbi:MAG: SRPBCC family protein [Solirubrobacteraceae bacterium]
MASYQGVVQCNKPAEAVFAYLAAFEHTSEWDPACSRAERTTTGELTTGSAFKLRFKAGGPVEMTLHYEIVEYAPPGRVRLRGGNGLLVSDDTITVEPTAGGSRVSYAALIALKGPGALLDPLLALGFARVGDRSRDGLAQRLARPI